MTAVFQNFFTDIFVTTFKCRIQTWWQSYRCYSLKISLRLIYIHIRAERFKHWCHQIYQAVISMTFVVTTSEINLCKTKTNLSHLSLHDSFYAFFYKRLTIADYRKFSANFSTEWKEDKNCEDENRSRLKMEKADDVTSILFSVFTWD